MKDYISMLKGLGKSNLVYKREYQNDTKINREDK